MGRTSCRRHTKAPVIIRGLMLVLGHCLRNISRITPSAALSRHLLESSDIRGRGTRTLVAGSHSTVSQTVASTHWQRPLNTARCEEFYSPHHPPQRPSQNKLEQISNSGAAFRTTRPAAPPATREAAIHRRRSTRSCKQDLRSHGVANKGKRSGGRSHQANISLGGREQQVEEDRGHA
jgi:hypothetical protein